MDGYDYDEFFVTFIGYFSLMAAGTFINDVEKKKYIINAFLVVLVMQGIVAFLQTCGIYLSIWPFCFSPKVAAGLFQNSNWYGGMTTLLCACGTGCYLFSENRKITILYYILTMFCYYTSLLSNARLAWVGNFCMVLFYFISLLIMKKRDSGYYKKRLIRLVWILAGAIVEILFCIFVLNRLTSRFDQTAMELSGFFSDFDAIGSGRGYIWRYCIEAIPGNWLFGVGLDNLHWVYTSNPRWHEGDLFNDKAHNEYLGYLVTQGVFQFINYMMLLIYAAASGIRCVLHTEDKEDRIVTWIFLGMFVGYATQAFFDSSVIDLAPYFWITIGMLLPRKDQKTLNLNFSRWKKRA